MQGEMGDSQPSSKTFDSATGNRLCVSNNVLEDKIIDAVATFDYSSVR